MRIDTSSSKYNDYTRELLEAIAGGFKFSQVIYRDGRLFDGVQIELKTGIIPSNEFERINALLADPSVNDEHKKLIRTIYPGHHYWECTYYPRYADIPHDYRLQDREIMEPIIQKLRVIVNLPDLEWDFIHGVTVQKQFNTWQEASEWRDQYQEFIKNIGDTLVKEYIRLVEEHLGAKNLWYRYVHWSRNKNQTIDIPFPLSIPFKAWEWLHFEIEKFVIKCKSKKIDGSGTNQ